MQKLHLFKKTKQYIKVKDRSFIMLIFCIICIILMCGCIMRQIMRYKYDCNKLSAQLEQRLDRCEELINQLNEKYTYMEVIK